MIEEHEPYTCKDHEDPTAVLDRDQFFHSRGRPYGRCKVHYAIRKKLVASPPRSEAWRVPVQALLTCHACHEPTPVLDLLGEDPCVILSQCSACRRAWAEKNNDEELEAPHALGPLDLVEQALYPGRRYAELTQPERHKAARLTRMLLDLPDLSPPPPGCATLSPDTLFHIAGYTHHVVGGRLVTIT